MYRILTENVLFRSQVEVIIKKYPLKTDADIVITDNQKYLNNIEAYYFLFNQGDKTSEDNNVFIFDSAKDLDRILPKVLSIIEKCVDTQYQLDETKMLLKQAEASLEDCSTESEAAYKLQKRIYSSQTSPLYDVTYHYQNYRCLSGDMFFLKTLSNKTYVILGDVTNHGTKAGVYGTSIFTLVSSYFNTFNKDMVSLRGLIDYLATNATVFGKQNDDTIHMVILEIDHNKNIVKQVCFAQGNEPVIMLNKDTGEIQEFNPTMEFDAKGHIITNRCYPEFNSLAIKPKDCEFDTFSLPQNYALLLYSDGIRELFKSVDDNLIENQYSTKRMEDMMKEAWKLDNLNNLIPAYIEDCNNFAISNDINTADGSNKRIINAKDDVTLLLLNLKNLKGEY